MMKNQEEAQRQREMNKVMMESFTHQVEEIKKLLPEISRREPMASGNNSGSSTSASSSQIGQRGNNFQNFPKFSGDNPRNWLRKCQKYFAFNTLSDPQKILTAGLHMEGKDYHWFLEYIEGQNDLSWVGFE